MKRILFVLLLYPFIQLQAQEEFSFTLKVTDSKGNVDSLILGYDNFATDSIDVAFGEYNIIGDSLNETLDFRASNYRYRYEDAYTKCKYQSKKQIVKVSCNSVIDYSHFYIDLKAKNWPITISWDSSLFINKCIAGGFYPINMADFGWTLHYLNETSLEYFWTQSSNCQNNTDSILPFIFYFTDTVNLRTNRIELEKLAVSISPNPTTGIVQIDVSSDDQFLELSTLQSQSILQQNLSNNSPENKIILDLSDYPSGVYFLTIITESGKKKSAKIVKQ